MKIKTVMRDREISAARISYELDLNVVTVRRWVNGETKMPVTEAIRIRNHFFPDLSVEDLFGE